MDWLLVLGLKEGLLECATVCVKIEVILKIMSLYQTIVIVLWCYVEVKLINLLVGSHAIRLASCGTFETDLGHSKTTSTNMYKKRKYAI